MSWTPQLSSQAQTRLLALERLQARGEQEVSALKRQLIALQQQSLDVESAVTALPVGLPSAPPSVSTGLCTDPIPFTLPVNDTFYGPASVDYQGVSGGTYTWKGIKQVNTPAGFVFCPGSVNTTICYRLTVNFLSSPPTNISILYQTNGVTACPIAGTFGVGFAYNRSSPTGALTTYTCGPPFQATVITDNVHSAIYYDPIGAGLITIG